MLGVSVQGGSGAGSRVVKTYGSWHCDCVVGGKYKDGHVSVVSVGKKRHPDSRYSCPDCGARRP